MTTYLESFYIRAVSSVDRLANWRTALPDISSLIWRQCCILLLGIWALVPLAMAQVPALGADSQFDVLGFIQEASLDNCGDNFCGGKIKLNGQTIIVPANTIVILPANALTWKELFTQAPGAYAGKFTGMALADVPAPLSTYEAQITGNQVNGTFIAGLIYVSQQFPNAGAGNINYIDYAVGELRVGGQLVRDASTGVPQNVLDSIKPGTRVRINDPIGRFTRPMTPDRRFTIDADNPTVRSTTGFPMCIPRVDPTLPIEDALCPQGNRPKDIVGQFLGIFTMPPAPTLLTGPQLPDPRIMAPFELGDYVTYAGTMVADTTTQGPFTTTDATYVSAHTLTAHLGIFTTAGTDPSYVAIDTTILGNGGVLVPGNLEAVVRTRFEGFTTDPSRNIHLYAVDVAPNGATSDRQWGIVGVDPGPPVGAVKGRWRFRPPCTGLTATFRFCFGPLDETTFLPASREVRAVIEGGWVPGSTRTEKNGLIAGQYHAPILSYIFQESFPGVPTPPINFASVPFLAFGGYSSSTGAVAGRLTPWPGSTLPGACTPAVGNAGTGIVVASGTPNVQLNGSASGTVPLTYLWTPPASVTLSSNTIANPTFTAPTVVANNNLLFSLTVTGCNGTTSTSTVTVTVTAATSTAPVVAPIANLTVVSGTLVSLTATATGAHPLTYVWTQNPGPVFQPFNQVPGSPTMSFTHTLLPGQVVNDILVFSVTATDTVTNAVSAPISASVTVTPTAGVDTITVATYRISRQRLAITATSSIVSPNVVLFLMPYVTKTGAIFDPSTVGNTLTNLGGGTYSLTIVGAPQPGPGAVLQVKSNDGALSQLFAATLLR